MHFRHRKKEVFLANPRKSFFGWSLRTRFTLEKAKNVSYCYTIVPTYKPQKISFVESKFYFLKKITTMTTLHATQVVYIGVY